MEQRGGARRHGAAFLDQPALMASAAFVAADSARDLRLDEPEAVALRRPRRARRRRGDGAPFPRAAQRSAHARADVRAARVRAVHRFHRTGAVRPRVHPLPARRARRAARRRARARLTRGRLMAPMTLIRTKDWAAGTLLARLCQPYRPFLFDRS